MRQMRKPSRLSDFYNAPELYAAYPELADVRVKFQGMGGKKKGAYSPAKNVITLNAWVRGEDARTALIHEIQHAIQNIEGFASGGNLEKGGERYHRLAGEAEARNIEKRTLLTDKERKERLLAETEDVAREDQIILEEMIEAYSSQQAEETENIRRGQAAMEKVITEQTDVMDAMHRDDLGSISFLWGEPGHGAKFKGGWGVSHIIAHRNAQGYDGPAVARKMAEVIAKGEAVNRRGPAGGERVDVVHDGHTAVLSLYKDGEQKTWLLSGWENYKKEAPDVSSEGDGSTGTTLSGPMRARPEEGAGASGNSKPPLPQKSKPESAINAQLTVQPDGMSLIDFFESANRSTSFHELAHHVFRMLDELSRIEGTDPQLRADVDEVLRHAGVTREEFDSEDAAVRRWARTQAHEYFAQGFETYIAEGRAPSRALRGVFRRLRAWMIEVYHDVVQALGIELSPETRDIYARLLATPEEITAETTVQELAVEDAAIKDEIRRCQAELRERSEQEQLGYEALDDWSFYEIPKDAEEAVTGWLGQLEEYEFKRNAHEAVQNVARTIRENGGLRFGDFIVQLGEDLARDVRKRWPGLFRNTTDGPQLALDVLTQTLQENRTKTGWVIREKALNRKKLLFARSEPLATDPGVGVVSRTGPYGNREGTAPNARQKSNFAATVSPGKAGVNTMLTLSEAMRRGYAMAEKYSREDRRGGAQEQRPTEADGRGALRRRSGRTKGVPGG